MRSFLNFFSLKDNYRKYQNIDIFCISANSIQKYPNTLTRAEKGYTRKKQILNSLKWGVFWPYKLF